MIVKFMNGDPKIKTILSFWFGDDHVQPLKNSELWWKKDPELDREVRERFADDLQRAIRGELDSWKATPEGRLSLILLLDQFSRNIHRDTPQAFSQDPLALELCLDGLKSGMDRKLKPVQRWFFYMPMMHTEDRGIQRRAVETFESLAREAPTPLQEALRGAHDYAERHAAVIERFGRFPHRNAILGRPSTPEEIEFLKLPGSRF
jgi:uncharacterized protein (DUF924 family)